MNHFKNNVEHFFDGEIHIYVEELLKPSMYLHYIEDLKFVLSLRTASLIELEKEKYISITRSIVERFKITLSFGDDQIGTA